VELKPLFDQQQAQTLQSVIVRIVPGDTSPGAIEADVLSYLMKQFQGDLSGYLVECRTFLGIVEQTAQEAYHLPFSALEPSKQDTLLKMIETTPETANFFRRLVEWVQEGYYTHPVAWEMIGWKVTG
jgi:hypothetical protein